MSAEPIRFGEADLTTCDREPIHVPGSIQPHGVLLVVERSAMLVEQWAGDTVGMFGVEPERMPGSRLNALLDAASCAFVESILASGAAIVAPTVRLGARAGGGRERVDLTLHAIERTAVIEIEPSRTPEPGAADPIAQLKKLLATVQCAASIEAACAAAARALRAVTGFDRAMVYRFEDDDSGVVVAEDARAGLESYLGLHYPASDIPAQARELYRRNWLRTITDIEYVPAPLQPPVNGGTSATLDMSHCVLRSVSPIHIEYLRNMGVRSSMSASIVFDGRLWGMLVLHHYSPRHVPADLRIACETFAQIFSLHIESKTQADTSAARLEARRRREELAAGLAGRADAAAAIAAWGVLDYVDATGAVVELDGRRHCLGRTPAAADVDAIIAWLNQVNKPLLATDHLAAGHAPAAAYPKIASGLLAVGLSREPRDYVIWFRPEIGSSVRWAGDPNASTKIGPLGTRLTPRGSFAEWLEVSRDRARPWSGVAIEAAEALRVLLLEFIVRTLDSAQRERALESTRAMAVELEQRVQQRTEQLRELASDLEAAGERERSKLARDLHDDLGQTLAAARIRLSTLCESQNVAVSTEAREVATLIDEAIASTRSLAAQLSPAVLHQFGLGPALEWLGEQIGATFGLRVEIEGGGEFSALSQEVRSILYRATRELLINAAKHSGADAATLTTTARDGKIQIRVADGGVGFDTGRLADPQMHGHGLVSLRERLALIDGGFEVRSTPGRGTVATMIVPLDMSVSRRREPRA